MDGDRPCETQWHLCDLCLYLSSLLYSPAYIVRYDTRTISKFDDRESLVSPGDMTDRPISIAGFEVIFHEHDTSSDLQDERLRSEASLFQSFDKRKWSLRMHLEEEYISSDRIESFLVIGIDCDIPREKFRMVLCRDRNMTWFEKVERVVWYSSRTDFVQYREKGVFSIFSLILTKLCRENTRDEASLTPDRMLESELDGRVSWNWRKLEEISDQYELYTSEWSEWDSSRPQESIEIREKCSWKHRYLIDHEHWGLRVSLHEVFPRDDVDDIIIGEGVSHTESTPGVYRHTSDMRRSYPCRSGDRDTDTMLMTVTYKSVHEKCLSTSCRSGEKYILPHREYVEGFVLDHDEECSQKEGKNNKKILQDRRKFLVPYPIYFLMLLWLLRELIFLLMETEQDNETQEY